MKSLYHSKTEPTSVRAATNLTLEVTLLIIFGDVSTSNPITAINAVRGTPEAIR